MGGRDKEFQDTDLGEIQELRDITPGKLIEDDLMEISRLAFEPVPGEGVEEAVPEN